MLVCVVWFLYLILGSCFADSIHSFRNKYSRDDDRIVGGRPVNVRYHPYQVSLEQNGIFYCGGSIISRTVILTAAHCVHNIDAKNLKVRVGTSYLGTGGILADVKSLKAHPKFELKSIDYDVGIITLKVPLLFIPLLDAYPVTLTTIEPQPGDVCSVTGWGRLEENGHLATQLQAVDVPFVAREVCEKEYPHSVTDRMICTGFKKGGRGPCNGDSGGALLNPKGKQVGIVSWAVGCARPKAPAVYTRIANLEVLEFILRNLS